MTPAEASRYARHRARMESDNEYREAFLAKARERNRKYMHSDNGRQKKRAYKNERYKTDAAYRAKSIAQVIDWANRNPDKAREKERKRRDCEKYRERCRRYQNKQYHADPQKKLASSLRSRLWAVLGKSRSAGALSLVGCSLAELRAHLESQFRPGMTWDSWTVDGWHIDHIRPLASFDLTDPDQQKVAFHYTNLQPLWAADNLSKGASLEVA